MFHNKNWVEEKGDEVVIGDIPVSNEKNQLTIVLLILQIKDIKKKKVLIKKGIFIDFHKEGTINTDETNGSTEEISLKCPISGCTFGGFAKKYDQYNTGLTERLITNNGNHDAVLAPNWNWIDWNYGEKEEEKEV